MFTTNEEVVNIEMQNNKNINFLKRSFVYECELLVYSTEKNTDYIDIKKTYVIFINNFDLFNNGEIKVEFIRMCRETGSISDIVKTIFYNLKSKKIDEKTDLGKFLKYCTDGKIRDNFTRLIDHEVLKLNLNEGVRTDYMKYRYDKMELIQEGRIEGIAEGRVEGLAEGRTEVAKNLLTKLNNKEISEVTNLSMSEIQKLREEMKNI